MDQKMSANLTLGSKGFDRRFYSCVATLAALIVFAGFARTFYLKDMFGAPTLPGLLLAHGTVMTLWFVLFIVQLRLVAAGRTDLHRRLGVFGAILVVLILAVGVTTAVDAARRGVTPAPGVTPLMFMAIPLVDLVVFAILVGVALWNRRRSDIHKRLMLLATLSILTPGIARIPLAFTQQGGLPVFFGLTVLFVIICVVVDTVKNRRLHPAFGWGATLVVASVPLRLMLAGTAAWTQFATWLVSR
jgi:hypothetical protein